MLEINDLKKTFENGSPALKGVNLKINKGEFVSILGPSGSGKTTLLRTINGLETSTGGEIYFDNKKIDNNNILEVQKKTGMIFQEFNLVNNLSAINNVLTGLLNSSNKFLSLFYLFKKSQKIEALKSLKTVGLLEKSYNRSDELSGGQRQRVSIARTLIMKPKFVVCDEPTSMLDVSIRISIMDLMLNLAKDLEVSYLYITHDLAVARYMCNRIAVMFNGKIVEIAETEELLSNPVHPYTKRLISSIPVPDPSYDRKVYDVNFDELDSLIEKYGSDKPMIDIGNEHYIATHDVKGLI